jgi:hypothetical protein
VRKGKKNEDYQVGEINGYPKQYLLSNEFLKNFGVSLRSKRRTKQKFSQEKAIKLLESFEKIKRSQIVSNEN